MLKSLETEMNLTSGTSQTEFQELMDSVDVPKRPEMDRDENLARIEIATLALIFVTTVLGNATVLLALWTRKR